MARKDHSRDEESLLSTSTILILSGLLIGMAFGKNVSEDLSPYVLACGVSGFLTFIALDIAKTRRKESNALEEQMIMEERLDKHVNSISSTGFTLPRPAETMTDEVEAEQFEVSTAS